MSMKHCHQRSFKGEEFVCWSFILDPVELAFMGEQLSRLNQEEHSKSYLPIILHLVANFYVSVVIVPINSLSTVKSFIFIIFLFRYLWIPLCQNYIIHYSDDRLLFWNAWNVRFYDIIKCKCICKRHERPNRLLEINNVKNCARSKWLNDIRYLEIPIGILFFCVNFSE